MINDVTPEQLERALSKKQKWINQLTVPINEQDTIDILGVTWKDMNMKPPQVLFFDSPTQCIEETAKLTGDSTKTIYSNSLFLLWQHSHAGCIEAGLELGVVYDQEKYDKYIKFCSNIFYCIPYDEMVIVSRKPTEVHWQDEELHNEQGFSVRFLDNTGIYSIEGVLVDEQIIMAPETQTIEEIDKEQNEEVKRIRIERYGILRYISNINADIVESRRNVVENTREILVNTNDGQRLITFCPSTGRRYFLTAPDVVNTCAEFQRSIWGNPNINIIGRT